MWFDVPLIDCWIDQSMKNIVFHTLCITDWLQAVQKWISWSACWWLFILGKKKIKERQSTWQGIVNSSRQGEVVSSRSLLLNYAQLFVQHKRICRLVTFITFNTKAHLGEAFGFWFCKYRIHSKWSRLYHQCLEWNRFFIVQDVLTWTCKPSDIRLASQYFLQSAF